MSKIIHFNSNVLKVALFIHVFLQSVVALSDASVNFWRSQSDSSKFPGKQCVFYNGVTPEARQYAGRTGKLTIWDTYDEATYMTKSAPYLKQWFDAGREFEYFRHQRQYSQVFAERCEGEALVMFPTDDTPDEPDTSIWTDTEFPTIRGELLGAVMSKVTKVTRVSTSGQIGRTIWTKPPTLAIQDKKMRIMALGDSITVGYPGNPSNSYRKRLEELLTDASRGNERNTITYIGSQRDGDFPDNAHEGESGATIDKISANADRTLDLQPNIVLLHAGTNNLKSDVAGDDDALVQEASTQIEALIKKIYDRSKDATVMVARIIPQRDEPTGGRGRVFAFNNRLYGIVRSRRAAGQHVWLVDHYTSITTEDLIDTLHPTSAGYNKMAEIWYLALKQVNSQGWIGEPANTGATGIQTVCKGRPYWIPFGQLATGAELGPDFFPGRTCQPYTGSSTQCGCDYTDSSPSDIQTLPASGKCSDLNDYDSHAVHFADLNNDGRADFIYVDALGKVAAYVNGGRGSNGWNWFPQPNLIATGVGGRRSQVRFADLNGDGRAEYIQVHDDGSCDVWLNQRTSAETSTRFGINWIKQFKTTSGIGRDGAGVRFADWSGDGKAEYLYVENDGAVITYLNGGPRFSGPDDAGSINWLPQKQSAIGVGGTRANTAFADVNGNGRWDYLEISRTNGSILEWDNSAQQDSGPNAAVIAWAGLTPVIALGVGTSGRGVMMADITGDGLADYLDVNPATSAVNMWENGCPDTDAPPPSR